MAKIQRGEYNQKLIARHNRAMSFNQSVIRRTISESLAKWSLALTGIQVPIVFARHIADFNINTSDFPTSTYEVIFHAQMKLGRHAIDHVIPPAQNWRHAAEVGRFHSQLVDEITNRHHLWYSYGQSTYYEAPGYSKLAWEMKSLPEAQKWIGLLEAFEAGAFAIMPTKDYLLVSTIPSILNFNASQQLHSETGPAISYLDETIYYFNGIKIDERLIREREKITLDQINHEWNTEIRRIMIELYGVERMLKDNKARAIDHLVLNGRTCTLYRHYLAHDGVEQAIKVTNATAEPDGTFKEYWLRVPPWFDTALDALAWTFNMTTREYMALVAES